MQIVSSNIFKGICLLLFVLFIVFIFAFLTEAKPGEISQTLATLLIGFVATLTVSLQIFFASMQAKQDHETSLKLNLYKEIASKVRRCLDPILELGSLPREYELELVLNEQTAGRTIPKIRYEIMSEKWNKKCLAVSDIKGLIEDWIVVDARLDLFKLAINSADYEVEKRFKLYLDTTMASLPRDGENGQGQSVVHWKPLESTTRTSLIAIGDQLHSDCLTLLTYTLDFRDQMQMSLLSSLFPNSKIEMRKPKDPKFIVLDIDKIDELEKYFMSQTEFGKKLTANKD